MAAKARKTAVKAEKQAAPAKPRKDQGPSRDERIQGFMSDYNKRNRGAAQVKLSSDYRLPFLVNKAPTGFLTLDAELRGGFPGGGISEIRGPYSSGKSFLVWQVVRQLQHVLGDKMRVMFAQTEMRLDRTQGRKAGVEVGLNPLDIDSLEKARGTAFTAEERAGLTREIGKIYEMHGESAENLYDGIIEAVRDRLYHLIVIDSFGSIMSKADSEAESFEDRTYGGASGVTTRFCSKLAALLAMEDRPDLPRNTCIIGINQIREDMKNPGQFRSPGGRALEHAKFVCLTTSVGARDAVNENIATPLGTKQQYVLKRKELKWVVSKGKAGIHEGGAGSYMFDLSTDTAAFYSDILVAAQRAGLVDPNTGSWFVLRSLDGTELLRANGRDAVAAALAADAVRPRAAGEPDTIMNRIRADVFSRLGISISYDDWLSE
jgi:RecA/RadA recombinase